MKKLFTLILVMLASVGVAIAQDVYLSGTSLDEEGHLFAVVFRNGSLLYQGSATDERFGYDVVVNPYDHDDVYWLELYYGSETRVSDIHRNNAVYSSLPGTAVGKLFWCDSGNNNPEHDLLSVGYRYGSDNKHYAAVWRGNEATPYLSPDFDDGRESGVMSVVAFPGQGGVPVVYYGGNRKDVSEQYEQAVVWRNDALLYSLTEPGVSGFVTSMDYYDGTLYSLVWEMDEVNGTASLNLYENQDLAFTVINGTALNYSSVVKVDDGDVYIYAFCDVNAEGVGVTKVWKNGALVYSHEGAYYDLYDVSCLDVTSDGAYFVGMEYDEAQAQGQYFVFHDEEVIGSFDVMELAYVTGLDVVMECQNDDARELPYFEGFEQDVTDWECWTVLDEHENYYDEGQSRPSYWHRSTGYSDVHPVTGDHLAYHNWNDGAAQEGWLISPKLAILPESECTLTFQTYEEYYNEMIYEGVFVSTTNTDPSSFTEVWTQNNPYNGWRQVEVDLSAYKGQKIYIAFKYAGFDGHSWYIDDINVTASYDGVNETGQDILEVYPNPTKETIRIEGLEEAAEVRIYNSMGALVKVVNVVADEKIGIGDLASGLYLLRCGNASLHFVKQ